LGNSSDYSAIANSPFETISIIKAAVALHVIEHKPLGDCSRVIRPGLDVRKNKKECVMGQNIMGRLLRRVIFGGALSVLLAATTMAAAAAPVSGGNFADHRSVQAPIVETLNNDTPAAPTIEPNPTDQGNIIIECVAFAGTPAANGPAQVRLASMPQHPLGPTKCSPPDLRHVQ
jgi:hypothetical protein